MDTLLTPDGSLWSLFAAALLAATLLPFSSEAALFAVLKLHPDLVWPALGAATAGNTLGGMTTYALGRWFAREKPLRLQRAPIHAQRLRRWGAPLTALAWLPLIGDGLALAAGWLNMNALAVLGWQALGRFARYWVVAQGAAL